MFKKQPIALGKILDQYLGNQANKHAFKQGKIKSVWALVVGPVIANQTAALLFYTEQKLTVYVKEAIWVHEIHMMREEIRKKLNQKIGSNFLTSIEVKLSRKS